MEVCGIGNARAVVFFFRSLYLRKFVIAKLVYLVFLVIAFHIFMFIVVPYLTQRYFEDLVEVSPRPCAPSPAVTDWNGIQGGKSRAWSQREKCSTFHASPILIRYLGIVSLSGDLFVVRIKCRI